MIHIVAKMDTDFENMLRCAVRYALGRTTYLPHIVVGYIKPLLGEISLGGKILIKADIDNYLEESKVCERYENENRKLWAEFSKEIDKSCLE